jgi:glycosyltransferase involved in cell wall biosynthesis
MTAYNATAFLRPTVESILAQTMGDFEFIIVDDGSTDDTPAMLAEFAKRDERIRVITQDNAGIPKAANAGLAECRADLIARMDSDDVAKPERFEKQMAYLDQHDLIACGTWHDLIDEKGRYLKTIEGPVDDATIQAEALRGHGSICNPTSMFRRMPFVGLGGYSEDLPVAEDLDSWLRLGEVGKLGNVPESLMQYRLHSKSISEQRCQLERDMAKLACERAWERRGIDNIQFEAGDLWRPGQDRDSKHRFAVEYGWWAFNSKQKGTAKAYAGRAIKLKAWHPDGWKLLVATRKL